MFICLRIKVIIMFSQKFTYQQECLVNRYDM